MDEVADQLIDQAMSLAINEARKGLGQVHPNPAVGCVFLDKQGKVLSLGYHQMFGGPHAEINALEKIKNTKLLEGATCVVSLEPCSHEGKTPSCAKRLAKLALAKVIFGVLDPNPLVAGKGKEILQQAGIYCEAYSGPKEIINQIEEVAEIFLWNHRHKKPFVAIKAATTRAGSLVAGEGQRWITGEKSREHVHFLRSQYDSVLVGVETFLKDNPRLDIRIGSSSKQNIAIVLDPNLRGVQKLSNSNLLKSRSADKIIWVCDKDASSLKKTILNDLGVKILETKLSLDGLALSDILPALYGMGVSSVFVEGGAHTFTQFLKSNLVNRIYHYQNDWAPEPEKSVHWLQGKSLPKNILWKSLMSFDQDVLSSIRLK